MARKTNPIDEMIIGELQNNGYIKSEAQAYLKKKVYKLDRSEIDTISRYVEHFGLSAQERVIEDILQIRREALMRQLNAETSEL